MCSTYFLASAGFSLGLERAKLEGAAINGFETVAFCEIEEFPRKVLAKHWPNAPCYRDVRELTAGQLAADGITDIHVITGGFPCQDISCAGFKAGITETSRSGLWSEIARLAGELRPQFIIVENVAELLAGPTEQRGGWFGRILGDLATLGFDAEWENIPAATMGAPHRRERIWIVAYTPEVNAAAADEEGIFGVAARLYAEPLSLGGSGIRFAQHASNAWLGGESAICRTDDGLPYFVAQRINEHLGNAVVPQIPELIGHAILASLAEHNTPAPSEQDV